VADNLPAFCATTSIVFKTASSVRRRCYLILASYLCVPLLLIAALTVAITGTSFAQSVEWEKVDAAIGRKATVSGDVHRYGFPRTDLSARAEG
jgi:hypothetical protein